MILQWVKLHDALPKIPYMSYDTVQQHHLDDGAVVSIGNKTTWKRENLWKCIEILDGVYVEYIVQLKDLKTPINVLLSKFITKDVSTYSHGYTKGINQISDQSKLISLPQILFNMVLQNTLKNGDTVITSCMYDWIYDHPSFQSFAPNNCDILYTEVESPYSMRNYISPMAVDDYIHIQSSDLADISITGPSLIAKSIYDTLYDVSEAMRNNQCGHQTMHAQISEIFAPWKSFLNKQFTGGSLLHHRSFQNNDVTVSTLDMKTDFRIRLDNLVAPVVQDCRHLKNQNVVPAIHSKELLSLVEIVNSINLTDMVLIFDINSMSQSDYNAVATQAFNRYFPQTEETFPFPYVPTSIEYIDYAFKEWTTPIGDRLCDYIVTLPDMMSTYDLVEITKTYNEDVYIRFMSYDKKEISDIYHTDIIGVLLSGTNVGTINTKITDILL